MPRKQVTEKCSLLATAPTPSLDQGGPIGFLRVHASQVSLGQHPRRGSQQALVVIRRPSYLVPPLEAVQIQKPMSVHSKPPTLPKFFIKYRMSRYLPWGAPRAGSELITWTGTNYRVLSLSRCALGGGGGLGGLDIHEWGSSTGLDGLPAQFKIFLAYKWVMAATLPRFNHQGGLETD